MIPRSLLGLLIVALLWTGTALAQRVSPANLINNLRVIGSILFDADNTDSIGATGANRPASLFLASPAITVGSGTGVTVNNSGEVRTLVYKVTVTYANCVANGTTCDLTIATLPAKAFLRRVLADLTAPYVCAATCTTATLSGTLGSSAGGAQFLASFDADAAAALFGDADAELGTAVNAAARAANGALFDGVLGSWSATTTVSYRVTSAAGNLGNGTVTNLNAGSVTFYLVTDVMP